MRELNIHLYTEPLPETVRGVVTENQGYYIICINNLLSEEEQQQAFIHEMLHIYNNDFNSGDSVQAIEERTHKAAERLQRACKQ